MAIEDNNSADQTRRAEDPDANTSRSRSSRNSTISSGTDWVTRDRRRPENARIRRWMDLGDQALSQD